MNAYLYVAGALWNALSGLIWGSVVATLRAKKTVWLASVLDAALEWLTGKNATQWLVGATDLISPSLATAMGLETNNRPHIVMEELLNLPRIRDLLNLYKKDIDEEVGANVAMMDWDIDYRPIPGEVSIYQWAKDMAGKWGISPDVILARRLAL